MSALTCVALAAYMEARQYYRTPDALIAVAEVVLNRAADPRWPATPCAVVAEPGQFPWYTGDAVPTGLNAIDQAAWYAAVQAAGVAQRGGLGLTSTHFRTVGKPQYWEHGYQLDGQIGGNVFFTNEGKTK